MGNAPSWSILYRTIPGYHNSIFFPTHFWYWWWWVIMTSQLYFFSYHNELLCRTINCYFWGNCNKDVKYILLLKNITLKPLSLLQRWIIVLCNCNPIQTVGVGGGRGGGCCCSSKPFKLWPPNIPKKKNDWEHFKVVVTFKAALSLLWEPSFDSQFYKICFFPIKRFISIFTY